MGASRKGTGAARGPSGLRLVAVVLALVGGLAGVLSATSRDAEAAPSGDYRFVKVADSAEDNLDPQAFGCATVNGRLVTIAQDKERFDLLGNSPSMNDGGQVSFPAGVEREDPQTGDDIEKILRGAGRGLTTIASTENRFNFFVFGTSINNAGRVAFAAELDERFDFDEGLFSGGGGAITTYYLSSAGRFDGSATRPAINDRGRIAFGERRDLEQGVFATRNRGGFVTIGEAVPDGFVGGPTFNNAGTAAFETSFTDETSGEFVSEIVTGRGGPLTTVADTRGLFGSFGFRPPALNNDGDVAFLAFFDNSENAAIFAGPAADRERVISTGDTLDGSTIQNIVFCEEGLSDTDKLAFVATLEDPGSPGGSREAVFRATPTP